MYVYKLVASFFCLLMAVGLTESRRMRRRRGSCENGTYQHEGKTCCMCPSGYRVISDCTDTNGTQCEICQSGFFAKHPNNVHNCRHCTFCNPEANLQEKERCSPYSDTVCECQNNHYCDKGHLCRTCQPCDTCEEQGGVKIQCTPTNNTVCNDAKASNGAVIAVPVVLVLLGLIIVGLIVFLVMKKLKNRKMLDPVITEPLKPREVDINPYLQEIASILPSKLMIDVARRTGMTEPNIEQHKLNHPNDVKEQTYQLLKQWSQAQGLNEAYPTLIKTLLELKNKRTADEITQIVERGQDTV